MWKENTFMIAFPQMLASSAVCLPTISIRSMVMAGKSRAVNTIRMAARDSLIASSKLSRRTYIGVSFAPRTTSKGNRIRNLSAVPFFCADAQKAITRINLTSVDPMRQDMQNIARAYSLDQWVF